LAETQHIHLRASLDISELSSAVESCLSKMNFEFIRNGTRDVSEFEIIKPVYFRVLLERRTDPEVRNMLIPSIKQSKGCMVDIWFLREHNEAERTQAFQNAKQLLRDLLATLPSPPWEGLRFRESGKERKRWQQLVT